MQVSELPKRFPQQFKEREGKVFALRTYNFNQEIEVEIVEAGEPHSIQLKQGYIYTNQYFDSIRVRHPVSELWPSGWFDIAVSDTYTPNGEPYKEW